LDFNNFY